MQKELTKLLLDFRDERDWEQFHDSKNLAIALSIEASELLEVFLWTKDGDVPKNRDQRLREEMADIFAYLLLIAEKNNIDLEAVTKEKIADNAKKYSVDKSKGVSTKYNEL